jgi:hypothetical protein
MPTESDGNIPKPGTANPDWHTYRTGGFDKAGRPIEKVYALDDDYVIYFSDCELFYETTPGLVRDLGSTNAALARINRLLPDNPKSKDSDAYRNKFSTLELVADACEMVFCGEMSEGLEILRGIQEKLQTTEEGKRRLMYQLGTVSITVLLWVVYLATWGLNLLPAPGNPWMLAAVLAAAGGVFSVCLNLGTLEVSVNQQKWFLLSAGTTRSLVALLAGIGLLLAMRSKMFAGIAYVGKPPGVMDPLTITEMFFCFLAGFSETFVPNILRDSQKKGGDNKTGKPESRASQTPQATGVDGQAVDADRAVARGQAAAADARIAESKTAVIKPPGEGRSPE